MDCSLPGSSVHGIFQARVLEWVAISFSRGSSQHCKQMLLPWVSRIVSRCFYPGATREVPHRGGAWDPAFLTSSQVRWLLPAVLALRIIWLLGKSLRIVLTMMEVEKVEREGTGKRGKTFGEKNEINVELSKKSRWNGHEGIEKLGHLKKRTPKMLLLLH